jgi:hypothetical protein
MGISCKAETKEGRFSVSKVRLLLKPQESQYQIENEDQRQRKEGGRQAVTLEKGEFFGF